MTSLTDSLRAQLHEIDEAGLTKHELVMTTPQSAHVGVADAGDLINLCANNYLGLASHPQIVDAAKEALDRWGFGMASVRFICGTQEIHRELEERLASFLGTDDAILYSSCFDANGGLFETLLGPEDAVISDALNHASIIDGIRLCKAQRHRYANGDIDELEARLRDTAGARHRLIATDGVFSMDGHIAKLDEICAVAERYDALVMVDDSHAVGFIGGHGRGTHELKNVLERVDILTGTLGKAMGGASGGYVAASNAVVSMLRQRSRPYLFSNSVAPHVVAATLRALDLVERSPELRSQLFANTNSFRERMTRLGFNVIPGEHPIVPIMIGGAAEAGRFAAELVARGVYAVAFSYPVVPHGTARIRTQMSAAHSPQDIQVAIDAFVSVRDASSP